MSSVRRVYFYLVTLITLGILAGGVGTLISLLFDIVLSGSKAIGQPSFNQQQFSLGIAMLVIGGPLWFFFWRSIQKHVKNNDVEIGATLRKLFLNFILVVSSLTAVFAAQTFLKWLISGLPQSQASSGSLATFLVAFGIWFFHWRVSEEEGHPSRPAKTLRRWYVYIDSGWGLILLTFGLVQLVDFWIRYLPWGNSLISGNFWGGPFQDNLPGTILGGILWAFHWFRMSKGDSDSTLRQIYIYLLAIVISSVVGLTALVFGLNKILVWAMGAANDVSASYFQFLSWVIPTFVVALAVWMYHQAVAQEESAQVQERRLSSKRVHYYIMSFISLATLTSGLVILIGTILNLIINGMSPAVAMPSYWWQKQLSLALSLLIVAVPLWWYYWDQIMHLSSNRGITEWRARSRRIYLYVIIGASIIALAADMVNIVYQLLSGLMTAHFGLPVLQKSRWSIQALVVALPLLLYHWQIARQDQRRGAEVAGAGKMVSALIDNQSRVIIGRLEKQIGAKIRVLEYVGTSAPPLELSDEELTKIASDIQSSSTAQVMLIIIEGKLTIFPYQEKP